MNHIKAFLKATTIRISFKFSNPIQVNKFIIVKSNGTLTINQNTPPPPPRVSPLHNEPNSIPPGAVTFGQHHIKAPRLCKKC